MLEKYFLRRPNREDFKNVIELMIRCDVRDVGFPDTDDNDLTYEWQDMDLSRDAWLAVDGKGFIRGYGAVMDWGKGKRIALYDDPGTEETDLFLGLSILCEKRAVNMLWEVDDSKKITLSNYVSDSAEYQKEILKEAGYGIAGYIFNMHIDLQKELPAQTLPDGVTIRTANIKEDARIIHALIQEAFDWKERDPQPFEEWEKFMVRSNLFDESLWFLAVKDGETIGTCLGVPYTDLGWVRQLAVKKPYRKQGIGGALLNAAYQEFKNRGYSRGGLAVESENEDAFKFYENAGMYKAVHLDEFTKNIPAKPSK